LFDPLPVSVSLAVPPMMFSMLTSVSAPPPPDATPVVRLTVTAVAIAA